MTPPMTATSVLGYGRLKSWLSGLHSRGTAMFTLQGEFIETGTHWKEAVPNYNSIKAALAAAISKALHGTMTVRIVNAQSEVVMSWEEIQEHMGPTYSN
jgi:hypothetical protein